MRITITTKLVGNKVSEGSAFSAIASYFDDSSDVWSAATPTSARYRIDKVNGSEPDCWESILGWTTLTPATSNTITVTGAQNAIVNDYARSETHQLTITANAGLSTQFQETYRFSVQNLAGVE